MIARERESERALSRHLRPGFATKSLGKLARSKKTRFLLQFPVVRALFWRISGGAPFQTFATRICDEKSRKTRPLKTDEVSLTVLCCARTFLANLGGAPFQTFATRICDERSRKTRPLKTDEVSLTVPCCASTFLANFGGSPFPVLVCTILYYFVICCTILYYVELR